jgi:hypothetical protein
MVLVLKRGFLLLLVFTLYTNDIISQNFIVYKDKEFKKYGIKDSLTEQIILAPKYQYLHFWKDSLFYAQKEDSLHGIINIKDEEIVDFGSEFMGIESEDSVHLNELYIYPKKYFSKYYIDFDKYCIPYNYYPCPCEYNANLTEVPFELVELQVSERFLIQPFGSGIDKALQNTFRIAYKYKTNPSLYFWPAELLLNKDFRRISIEFPFYSHLESYLPLIDQGLVIADSLEKNRLYNIRINNHRLKIYSKYIKDKEKKKEVIQKLYDQNASPDKRGLFGIIGLNSYFNDYYAIELGMGQGIYLFNKNKPYQSVNLFFGASLEFIPLPNTVSFKFYVLAIQAPVNFGLYPIFYSHNDHFYAGIRPEIGFGYRGSTFSYGYNIVSKENMPEFRGHFLSLRYNLPLFTETVFY